MYKILFNSFDICTVCNGTGNEHLDIFNMLTHEDRLRNAVIKSCRHCNGTGWEHPEKHEDKLTSIVITEDI